MSSALDLEIVGSENDRQIQKMLFDRQQEIADYPGLVSRGTRVTLLDAFEHPEDTLLALAERFGSTIFFLQPSRVDDLRDRFEDLGYSTTSFLIFSGTPETVEKTNEMVADDIPKSLGMSLSVLDEISSPELVSELQELLTRNGLPALPGYFLRGRTQANLTVCLIDSNGRMAAAGMAMDESNAGEAFSGWYFPSSIAVEQAWRGHGLGRWINAHLLQRAIRKHGAVRFNEGVSPANKTSQSMIRSCGLERNEDVLALSTAVSGVPEAWRDQ